SQPGRPGDGFHAVPSQGCIPQHLWPADEGNLTVAQTAQMLHRNAPAGFIVHYHRTHSICLQLRAYNYGWYPVPLQVCQQIDIYHQPVGNHDHALNTPPKQQLQIAFETAAIVMGVRKDGKMGELVQRPFNTPQDGSAIWVLDIKDHEADCGGALAAQ